MKISSSRRSIFSLLLVAILAVPILQGCDTHNHSTYPTPTPRGYKRRAATQPPRNWNRPVVVIPPSVQRPRTSTFSRPAVVRTTAPITRTRAVDIVRSTQTSPSRAVDIVKPSVSVAAPAPPAPVSPKVSLTKPTTTTSSPSTPRSTFTITRSSTSTTRSSAPSKRR